MFSSYPNVNRLTGTTGQISASNATGSITLSLPQNIDPGADVIFDTINGISITNLPTGWRIAGGTVNKTLTVSNSVIIAASNDTSTLNIGVGGTLGTNAFTSAAGVPATTTINSKPLSTNITLVPADLGASSVGINLFTLATPGSNSYLQINSDSSITPKLPATLKSDLGLVVGTDIQPHNANLDSLASASSTNAIYYRSGVNTWTPVAIGANLSFATGTLTASTSGGGGTVTTTGSPPPGSLTKFSSGLIITNTDLTGDVTTGGSTTTALTNIPNAVTLAGTLSATNTTAPAGTPATGKTLLYVDSAGKTFAAKNDAGVITHGVQTQTAATSLWIRGINNDGSIVVSQPAFTDIFGTVASTQIPGALTGKTIDDTNTITVKTSAFTIEDATVPTKAVRFDLSTVTTASTAIVTIPTAASTTITPLASTANNFVIGVTPTGTVIRSQPTFSNIGGGTLPPAQFPPLSGDVTVPPGSTTTTITNIPSATTVSSLTFTAATGLATPAAGKGTLYVEASSKNFAMKNDTGAVNHGVQTFSSGGSTWIKTISDAGAVTSTQPTFTDVGGSTTNAQLPPIIQNKTLDNTNSYTAVTSAFTLQDPSNTAKAATFGLSNITGGFTRVINVPDANSTTIQPSAGASTKYVTGVTAQGILVIAQPTFTDVGGTAGSNQITANLTSKILDNSNTITVRDDRFTIQDNIDTTKQVVFDVTNVAGSSTKTISVPNANTTTVQPNSGAPTKYVTGVSTQGVVTIAQPAFSEITGVVSLTTQTSGTIPPAQMPPLLGDVQTTTGSMVTTLTNIPVATPASSILFTSGVASGIATPIANKGTLFVETSSKNFAMKNDAGVLVRGVQSVAVATNKWITGIADDGSISTAQPAFSNVSGTVSLSAQTSDALPASKISGTLPLSQTSGTLPIGQLPPITNTTVGLGNVTNDAQAKATIYPNTVPTNGQVLLGDATAGGFVPVAMSGSGATVSLNKSGVLTISGISNASLTGGGAVTIAGTSVPLGGSVTLDNTLAGSGGSFSGLGILKRTGANAIVIATANTDYLTPGDNLNSLTDKTQAKTNLGAGTAGSNIFALAIPGASGYVQAAALTGAASVRSYAQVKTDLALTIGTNVQAYSANLDGWANQPAEASWDGIVKVTGADFTSTASALTQITGLQSATLSNSTLYEFEVMLYCNSSDVNGLTFGVDGPGGLLTSVVFAGEATGSGTTTNPIGNNVRNSPTTAFLTQAAVGVLSVCGFVKTSSTGSPGIIAKIGKVTAGTATVFIGSNLKWRQAA